MSCRYLLIYEREKCHLYVIEPSSGVWTTLRLVPGDVLLVLHLLLLSVSVVLLGWRCPDYTPNPCLQKQGFPSLYWRYRSTHPRIHLSSLISSQIRVPIKYRIVFLHCFRCCLQSLFFSALVKLALTKMVIWALLHFSESVLDNDDGLLQLPLILYHSHSHQAPIQPVKSISDLFYLLL